MHRHIHIIFAAMSLALACQAEPDGHELQLEGARAYLAHTWPKGRPIPVCFETFVAEHQRERALVRAAVEGSWAKVAALEFTGWKRCEAGTRGLRVAFSDEAPHTLGLGEQLDGVPSGIVLNLGFERWSVLCKDNRDWCIAVTAIHEFGHAIGFAHEQNRPDAPDWCRKEQGPDGDLVIGEFDTASVMNYCNPRWNGEGLLSAGDIMAAQAVYGSEGAFRSPDITRGLGRAVAGTQWLAADLDGDGRTDLVQVAGGILRVYRSEGGTFAAHEGELAVPAGALARVAADLDGDGRAEVLQLSDDAGRMAATVVGAAEGPPRVEVDDLVGALPGAATHLVGDIDRDGADEVVQIAIRDHSTTLTTLALRHGEVVVLAEDAAVAPAGGATSTWHTADIDADGRLDVVQAWSLATTQGFTAYRSTGRGFVVHWSSTGTGPLLRAARTVVGDFTGDRRTDIVQLFDARGALGVALFTASGSGYRGELDELGAAPKDPQATLVGDFDGDGLADLLMPHAHRDRLALAEYRATGDGFVPGFTADNFGRDAASVAWLGGDVDGDGRGDLIRVVEEDGEFKVETFRSDL